MHVEANDVNKYGIIKGKKIDSKTMKVFDLVEKAFNKKGSFKFSCCR